MTIWTIHCGEYDLIQDKTSNEMLLGFWCMWRFGYVGPDMMCKQCGYDHCNWKSVDIKWEASE